MVCQLRARVSHHYKNQMRVPFPVHTKNFLWASGLFHTVLSVSVGSSWFSVTRFTFFQYNSGFFSGSISSKLSLFISRRSSGSHNQSGYSSLAFSFGSDKKASLSSSLTLKISAAFSLQTFKPQQNSWSLFVSWI